MPEAGGKRLTAKQKADIDFRCSLEDLINQIAWPHGQKITEQLLKHYDITRKGTRPHTPPIPTDAQIAINSRIGAP